MSDLVEFLRARLDEDERIAYSGDSSPWRVGTWHQAPGYDAEILDRHGHITAMSYHGGTTGHIERFNPTRMLAEVEAKRRIIGRYERLRSGPLPQLGILYLWQSLVDLAQPYADHRDFDPEWKL